MRNGAGRIRRNAGPKSLSSKKIFQRARPRALNEADTTIHSDNRQTLVAGPAVDRAAAYANATLRRLRQRHPAQRPPAVPALLEVQHGVQLADPAAQGPGVEVLAVDVLRLHEARVPGIAVDGEDVQMPLLGIDPERVVALDERLVQFVER